jgi:hypothetical protein
MIPALIACCCLSSLSAQEALQSKLPPETALAQDLSATVIRISEFKVDVRPKKYVVRPSTNPMSYLSLGAGVGGATGFCVDPECRFVGTNYHATLTGAPRKIKGERIVQQYVATGPDDGDASLNQVGPTMAKYNVSRDLAIFELRHSLAKHHGIGFNLDDLEPGQKVDIYGYPQEGLNPFRNLMQFSGTFKGETTKGLLAFDYSLSNGKAVHGGASGGIIVDRKTRQIVGILNGGAKNGDLTVTAVPVQTLADFISQVEPYLAQRLFPHPKVISPVSADRCERFVWPPGDSSHHRPEEPYEIHELRMKAQELVNSMRNFVAVQTFEWGKGAAGKDPSFVAAYEIQIVDGHQRYCDYPYKRWCTKDNAPFPSTNYYVPASEWSELPKVVSSNFRLRIHQAPDTVAGERKIKIFQWEANLEDNMCGWHTEIIPFLLSIEHSYGCYGEVWTDEALNILRISEHVEDEREKDFNGYVAVVTYGWLKRSDEAPRLVPVTISTKAEHKGKFYWCRGLFQDYRVFGSQVKVIWEESHASQQMPVPK